MSEIAIRAEGLGKKYRLGELWREDTLRNVLGNYVRAPWKLLRREKREVFWALKDVDLEVKHGEVLGLIGRNGAGKTTLLKILSRITRPTSGWAEIYGRVGSLLEVGTGFHPELSGRDNVYLSGAILGMSKEEISRKFDEIVAFAEIEKFLDTQVKHYSSGMYVRLAFAVAAHLEPEILLVDEVLAVGDVSFQKKCLGKMGDVARAGRTVILVSHNLAAITQLSHRTVWVDEGSIAEDGASDSVVAHYLKTVSRTSENGEWERSGSGRVKFTAVNVLDGAGNPCTHLPMGEDVVIRASGVSDRPNTEFNFSAQFITTSGTIALWMYDQLKTFRVGSTGEFSVEMRIPRLMLLPGTYMLSPWLGRAGQETFDWLKNAVLIDIVQSDRVPLIESIDNRYGLVYASSETTQVR